MVCLRHLNPRACLTAERANGVGWHMVDFDPVPFRQLTISAALEGGRCTCFSFCGNTSAKSSRPGRVEKSRDVLAGIGDEFKVTTRRNPGLGPEVKIGLVIRVRHANDVAPA